MNIFEQIECIAIVPVIKIEDVGEAANLAKALIDGGINCAEVTFRASGAEEAIKNIAKAFPDMIVGAGTVTTVEQAEKAAQAGAKFCVAPGFNPKIAQACKRLNLPFVPGVSSCSEIEAAMELGFNILKFFPAEQAGGLSYIKAVCAPYTTIRFMPTGGINENNLNDYLAYDKIIACGGSWMVNAELIKNKNWAEITRLSRSAVDKMLGLEFAHVGIGCDSEKGAMQSAEQLNALFGTQIKNGNSSIFAGSAIELLKKPAPVHLGFKTNSVERAVYHLTQRGYEFDQATAKKDDKGKLIAIYFKKEVGAVAVHLVRK